MNATDPPSEAGDIAVMRPNFGRFPFRPADASATINTPFRIEKLVKQGRRGISRQPRSLAKGVIAPLVPSVKRRALRQFAVSIPAPISPHLFHHTV